jgi:hypothetical protein
MRIEHPFPQTPSARIYRQPFWQQRAAFAELALDSPCPYDSAAGLVDEGPQQSVGGAGIVSMGTRLGHTSRQRASSTSS